MRTVQGNPQAVHAWESLEEYIEFGSAETIEEACREDLSYVDWPKLSRLGRAVTNVEVVPETTKEDLLDQLADRHVFTGPMNDDNFYVETNGTAEAVSLPQTRGQTMSESESADEQANSLEETQYMKLTNLSRSVREQYDDVDIPTDSPTKDELVNAFHENGVRRGDDGNFYIETDDGEEQVELLETQSYDSSGGSSGSSTPKTVLYCFTRQATTVEDIEKIQSALEEAGYFIEPSSGEDDKFMIKREADEESSSDSSDAGESESSDDEGDSSDDDEESADGASDASESESEDEGEAESEDEGDDLIPWDAAEENLMDKTKDEVYSIAVDEDIDGRSSMSKEDLVQAILENRVGDKVSAP